MPSLMSTQVANVRVGAGDRVTGTVMRAAPGTVLPTDASTAPNVAFSDSGYISDAGLKFTPTLTFAEIRDMNGDLIRKIQQTFTGVFDFAFLETNNQSVSTYLGGANTSTIPGIPGESGPTIAGKVNSADLEHFSWLFHLIDGTSPTRIAVPDGQVGDRQPLAFSKTAAIIWGVTLQTFPDSSGNNAYVYVKGAPVLAVGLLPTITSALPAAAVTGADVTLVGTNMLGVTGFTVGGVWVPVKGTPTATGCVFTMPAGAAGSAPIRAVSPAGGSLPYTYSRG